MVTVADISSEQRNLILALPEGHFHDVKSRDIAPGKLTRTISAFANAAGGELYVGIDERVGPGGAKIRSWRGFVDPEEANGHLQAFEQVSPLGTYVRATFLQSAIDPGLVLQLEVLKTREIAEATDEVVYVRRGAQNLPQTTDEQLARLRLDKGITSFEIETVNADARLVIDSPVLLEFLSNIVPTAEPEAWLRKQLLLVGDKPTVAGVLLFAELPQAILPKRCGIKILRYRTIDAVGTRETLAFDPLTIEGSLYDQIAAAVLETVRVVDGRRPGHVEQFARNGMIVRLINKFPDPPNRDVGEGLNTAFRAMRALRLKDPVIEDRETSVVIHIRHERLASMEEAILTYLKKHDEINNAVARKITGTTSENKMKEVFHRLRDAGSLERVPGRFGSASVRRRPLKNGGKNGVPPE